MPTESAPPPLPRTPSFFSTVKCDRCGARCSASQTSQQTAFPASDNVGGQRRTVHRSYSDTVRFGDSFRQASADGLDTGAEGDEGTICASCGGLEESSQTPGIGMSPVQLIDDSSDAGQRHGQATSLSSVGLGLSLRGMLTSRSKEVDIHSVPTSDDISHRSISRTSDASSPDLSDLTITPSPPPISPQPIQPADVTHQPETRSTILAQSLPAPVTQPWTTSRPADDTHNDQKGKGKAQVRYHDISDRPYDNLLDVTTQPISNKGRGALYAGSVFRGTQTSGRSAYDVEIRFLEVNLASSTCSGYLTISNLTDTHPSLTTFFNAELIGETYGFITGGRWGASEHDDLRHWGRFEQFRRPSVRGALKGDELYLRNPVPEWAHGHGSGRGKDRDFVFLRMKERFLVPDHRVKDISGASFAGFYYAMLDLTPSSDFVPYTSPTSPRMPLPSPSPISPTTVTPTTAASAVSTSAGITSYFSSAFGRRTGTSQTHPTAIVVRPPTGRRQSSTASIEHGQSQEMAGGTRRRRESATRGSSNEGMREATIRGYYFHSLNQEPFQELFLTHVPEKSRGVCEMR